MLMKFSWQDTAVVCHCLLQAIQCIWATCLAHKGRGIPLSALPNYITTNFPTCSPQPPVNAERQAGSRGYHFLKFFGMSQQENEPQVYRL